MGMALLVADSLISAGIHIMLPQLATFERAIDVIKRMIVWAAVLAVTAQIISYLGSGVSTEGAILAGYGLPQLFGKMTFLPGGIGVVESTMAAIYSSLGVPNAVTVVVVFTYRFISFWLPTLMGFFNHSILAARKQYCYQMIWRTV
jgi:uncharacterized membrane protein YbhN (UPF0104 family)